MAKVKLTKNELKKQKDALAMYRRYLPTLQLKRQQLQAEIASIQMKVDLVFQEIEEFKQQISSWLALFGESYPLEELVKIGELCTKRGNIAGVGIPLFEKVLFQVQSYDLFATPIWIDEAIQAIQDTVSLHLESDVYREQKRCLEAELRVTTQRVNLFEKIKIPETKGNIKKISVYMGDQQRSAVVCGKISKAKLEERNMVMDPLSTLERGDCA